MAAEDAKKRIDLFLYGTALVLAIGGGALALSNALGGEPSASAPSSAAAPAPAAAPSPAPAPVAPDLPDVPDLRAQPPPTPPPDADEDPRLADLAAEMRYLSRARELLAEHPAEAFGVLEQHRRRYPRGGLSEQREAFAIEALASLGHRDLAERRYYDFLRDYPESPLTARLTALLR